jgi:uncharacterized membrane protein (UPF0136 family)
VGALAGSVTLTVAYGSLRRARLTQVHLAETLAPGRPFTGRLLQTASGIAANLPAAALATPAGGLVTGIGAGATAAATQRSRRDRALALATHTLAALVAARVSRAARARR